MHGSIGIIISLILLIAVLRQRKTINELYKKIEAANGESVNYDDSVLDEAVEEERDYDEDPELPLRDFEVHLTDGSVVTVRAEAHKSDGEYDWFNMKTGYCVGEFHTEDIEYWTAKVVEDSKSEDPKLDDPETWRGIGEEPTA